jgi:hypothetical protein
LSEYYSSCFHGDEHKWVSNAKCLTSHFLARPLLLLPITPSVQSDGGNTGSCPGRPRHYHVY